ESPKKETVFLPAAPTPFKVALGKKGFHSTSMKARFIRFIFRLVDFCVFLSLCHVIACFIKTPSAMHLKAKYIRAILL
ncbi:MAG: hypothetical protein ACM3UY_06310, partial [Methanocella sp.]